MPKTGSEEFEIASIKHLDVTGKIKLKEKIGFGGHSDVWQGTMRGGSGKIQIAIKELRVRSHQGNTSLEVRLQKRFLREVVVWNQLHHPNVVPLLGFTMAANSMPTLVSPLYPNGNIVEYLSNNPSADRPRLLLDVANGLFYLHSLPLVHGDIKGDNVLISCDGIASLCDFGMSQFIDDALHITGFTTTGQGGGGTPRCLCPEILNDQPRTKMSDVWAFGCTAIQIMTGQPPYYEITNPNAVSRAVLEGQPPLPMTYVAPNVEEKRLWKRMRSCWEMEPQRRPDIGLICGLIEEIFFSEPKKKIDANLANEWQIVEAEIVTEQPKTPIPLPLSDSSPQHQRKISFSGRTAPLPRLGRRFTLLRSLFPHAATDTSCISPPVTGDDILSGIPEATLPKHSVQLLIPNVSNQNTDALYQQNSLARRKAERRNSAPLLPTKPVSDGLIEKREHGMPPEIAPRKSTLQRPKAPVIRNTASFAKSCVAVADKASIRSISNTSTDDSNHSSLFLASNVAEDASDALSLTNQSSSQSSTWSQSAKTDLISQFSSRAVSRNEIIREMILSEERYVNKLIILQESFINPLLHPPRYGAVINKSYKISHRSPITSRSKPHDGSIKHTHLNSTSNHYSISTGCGTIPLEITDGDHSMPRPPTKVLETDLKIGHETAGPSERDERCRERDSVIFPRLSFNLRKCLEILEQKLLKGHAQLSRDLRQSYFQKYPFATDPMEAFFAHLHLLDEYVDYIQHLGQALRDVNTALGISLKAKSDHLGPKEDARFENFLRYLDMEASRKGKAGLAISLALPFERLLEYSLMVRSLLLHAGHTTPETSCTLQLATKLESIFGMIEHTGMAGVDEAMENWISMDATDVVSFSDHDHRPHLRCRSPDPSPFSTTAVVGVTSPILISDSTDRRDESFVLPDDPLRNWKHRGDSDSVDTDRKAVTNLSRQGEFDILGKTRRMR